MVKINWDAALDTHNKKLGVGIIMKDEKGTFLAALSKKNFIDVTSVVAEAIAALHTVMWFQEQGFMRVFFKAILCRLLRRLIRLILVTVCMGI
jgi:hypothetical protein